jgi:hypothetical protein
MPQHRIHGLPPADHRTCCALRIDWQPGRVCEHRHRRRDIAQGSRSRYLMPSSLAGRIALVVEDEPLIALDLETALRSDLRSLTPNAALEALQTHRIFTAIVDPSSASTDALSCALREGWNRRQQTNLG